jgi:hypothetical protein
MRGCRHAPRPLFEQLHSLFPSGANNGGEGSGIPLDQLIFSERILSTLSAGGPREKANFRIDRGSDVPQHKFSTWTVRPVHA